jgi:Skp family chaperone for outer membrane proteins
VGSILILPIVIAIIGFIGAGIAFLIWKVMGSQEPYETAYRCVAYTGALSPLTTLLGIIPFLGAVLGILIGTYFIVIASVEVHKIPVKKAWTVFGIIAVIFILLNISGQFAARRLSSEAERVQKEMQEATTQMEKKAEESKKAAEEAGKAASNMSEEMQRQMEKQAEEMKKAAEAMQKQAEEMKKHNAR